MTQAPSCAATAPAYSLALAARSNAEHQTQPGFRSPLWVESGSLMMPKKFSYAVDVVGQLSTHRGALGMPPQWLLCS